MNHLLDFFHNQMRFFLLLMTFTIVTVNSITYGHSSPGAESDSNSSTTTTVPMGDPRCNGALSRSPGIAPGLPSARAVLGSAADTTTNGLPMIHYSDLNDTDMNTRRHRLGLLTESVQQDLGYVVFPLSRVRAFTTLSMNALGDLNKLKDLSDSKFFQQPNLQEGQEIRLPHHAHESARIELILRGDPRFFCRAPHVNYIVRLGTSLYSIRVPLENIHGFLQPASAAQGYWGARVELQSRNIRGYLYRLSDSETAIISPTILTATQEGVVSLSRNQLPRGTSIYTMIELANESLRLAPQDFFREVPLAHQQLSPDEMNQMVLPDPRRSQIWARKVRVSHHVSTSNPSTPIVGFLYRQGPRFVISPRRIDANSDGEIRSGLPREAFLLPHLVWGNLDFISDSDDLVSIRAFGSLDSLTPPMGVTTEDLTLPTSTQGVTVAARLERPNHLVDQTIEWGALSLATPESPTHYVTLNTWGENNYGAVHLTGQNRLICRGTEEHFDFFTAYGLPPHPDASVRILKIQQIRHQLKVLVEVRTEENPETPLRFYLTDEEILTLRPSMASEIFYRTVDQWNSIPRTDPSSHSNRIRPAGSISPDRLNHVVNQPQTAHDRDQELLTTALTLSIVIEEAHTASQGRILSSILFSYDYIKELKQRMHASLGRALEITKNIATHKVYRFLHLLNPEHRQTHTDPLGPAFTHRSFYNFFLHYLSPAHYELLIDPSMDLLNAGAFFWAGRRAVLLRIGSSWLDFVHEATHFLVSIYGIEQTYLQLLARTQRGESLDDVTLSNVIPEAAVEAFQSLGVDPRILFSILLNYARGEVPLTALHEALATSSEVQVLNPLSSPRAQEARLKAYNYGLSWLIFALEALERLSPTQTRTLESARAIYPAR